MRTHYLASSASSAVSSLRRSGIGLVSALLSSSLLTSVLCTLLNCSCNLVASGPRRGLVSTRSVRCLLTLVSVALLLPLAAIYFAPLASLSLPNLIKHATALRADTIFPTST